MSGAAHPNLTPGPAALLIENGPHAGARVLLAGQRSRVGRDAANEVVLADDLLAPTHFMLDCRGGGFHLHALGGPVATGGGTLAAGTSTPCASGAEFRAGGTAFRLVTPPVPATAAPRRRGAMLTGFSAGAAFTAIILTAVATGDAATLFRPPPAPASPAPVPATAARTSTSIETAGLVGDHLAAEELGNIVLAALPDGSVEAAGEIMAQQVGAWRQAQRWFDAGFAGRAVLVNHVTVSAAAPPLAIQAVWPGANPYIIDAGGQKLFAGAPLRGGWVVERILADRVMIRRGAQVLAVRF